MTELDERSAVVAEARSWLGTRFGHRQRVKGVEVDCANLVAQVFERTDLIPPVELPEYTRDWFSHSDANPYAAILNQYFVQLPTSEHPQRGDLATYRWGRCDVAHAAIVVAWPQVIYASSWSARRAVELGEGDRGPLGHRLSGCWTLRSWREARRG